MRFTAASSGVPMKRMRNGVTPSGKWKSPPRKSKIVVLLQYLIHFAQQILKDLNVGRMRLLSRPRKMPSMTGYDLEISGFEPGQ